MTTSRYVETVRGRYLVRGNHSVTELRNLYASFCVKYRQEQTAEGYDKWLRERGKVYVRVSK